MKQRPFWFLLNIYGWIVFGMSVATAYLVGQAWIVLLGMIGYQTALLVDLILGRSLGRTGAVRLAMAEQENRELKAEQARLIGAIRERDAQLAAMQTGRAGKPPSQMPEPGQATEVGPDNIQDEAEQG